VGLLAREIEASGVTTSALALAQEVAIAAHAPRFVNLHWPFGHALGEPGHVAQQRSVLYDMLSMATSAPHPGLVIALPYRWRRETYPPVGDWKTPSQAGVSALSALN
jgi:D-proline reductase (dithiol) PrdB